MAEIRPHPGDSQRVELLGRNRLIDELLRDNLEVALPIRDRGMTLTRGQSCLLTLLLVPSPFPPCRESRRRHPKQSDPNGARTRNRCRGASGRGQEWGCASGASKQFRNAKVSKQEMRMNSRCSIYEGASRRIRTVRHFRGVEIPKSFSRG